MKDWMTFCYPLQSSSLDFSGAAAAAVTAGKKHQNVTPTIEIEARSQNCCQLQTFMVMRLGGAALAS